MEGNFREAPAPGFSAGTGDQSNHLKNYLVNYLGQAGFGYMGVAVAMLFGQMISMAPFCH